MKMKERGAFLAGNDRFEGYLADILERLAASVGFSYEIRLSRDGVHGHLGPDGRFNGMIGEIQSGVWMYTRDQCWTTPAIKEVGIRLETGACRTTIGDLKIPPLNYSQTVADGTTL